MGGAYLMSETSDKFEIETGDGETLTRNSTIEHADHGPMHVDRITIGPYGKRVQLQAELSNVGLKLSEEEVQEEWGETLAADPFELHEPGTASFESESISVEDSDIELTLKTEGPEADAEVVHVHTVDQIVRALQALRDEQHPDECDGADIGVVWDDILDDEDGGSE